MTVSAPSRVGREASPLDESSLRARLAEILNRRPAVGLAVGVIHNGDLEFFYVHGLADISSGTPVTRETVFRIGSITKTFTAIAILQLWEQGLIELEAPANDYLLAFELVPARADHRPATIRDLLTYTAGLPQALRLTRAFQPTLGEMVEYGRPVPTLDEFYQDRLYLVAEPGTTFTYSNHSFATLGQIVEDVTGEPLDRYFREHIFDRLGMEQTDLLRSERVADRLATEYRLGYGGPRPIHDLDLITVGSGGVYSTTKDMGLYVSALLSGGANEHGRVIESETLAAMFAPQYQPDPRLPGVGFAFFRREVDGHPVVEKDGLVRGFASQLFMAPRDGIGLVAFTNGARAAHAWLGAEMLEVLRGVLAISDDRFRASLPHHPETWVDLCGWYEYRGSFRDVQRWAIAGVEISVERGQLRLRMVTPIPGMGSFSIDPDDEDDPDVYRIDLSNLGMGSCRVVFSRSPVGEVRALHVDLPGMPMSFRKRSPTRNPRRWAKGMAGALAIAGVGLVLHRRGARPKGAK